MQEESITYLGDLGHSHLLTRDATLGNVATITAFRPGEPDAELLAKEFYPEMSVTDLISLPNYQIYLKLMIEGVVSRPFSGGDSGSDRLKLK